MLPDGPAADINFRTLEGFVPHKNTSNEEHILLLLLPVQTKQHFAVVAANLFARVCTSSVSHGQQSR